MNEWIFFLQILILIFFILGSSRLGKGAMIAVSCLLSIMANLFVLKQANLFGLEVTCADAYAVGAIVSLNLFQDQYGKEQANKLIWTNFLCMILFALMSQLNLLFIPSTSDWSHGSFQALFLVSPRILLASLFSYFVTQKLDIEIFAKLRNFFNKKYFIYSLFISIFFSQLIDTCLFSFLGLYGIVSSLSEIIIFSMAIKLLVILIMSVISGLYRVRVQNEI